MGIDILKNQSWKELKGIHLFHHPSSNNAMRARLILEEKQIPWESHIINLTKFEQFSSEYLQINPQGSVPALIHNGTPIYGSENILKYIEFAFPKKSLTCIANEQEMWNWVEAATRTHINSTVYYLYSIGLGRPARKDKLHFYKNHNYDKYKFLIEKGHHMADFEKQEALNIIHAQLLRLEEQLVDKDYIMGNTLTIADIAWIPNPLFLEGIGLNISHYKNVVKWIDKIKNRPLYNEASKMPKFPKRLAKLYFKCLLLNPSYLK